MVPNVGREVARSSGRSPTGVRPRRVEHAVDHDAAVACEDRDEIERSLLPRSQRIQRPARRRDLEHRVVLATLHRGEHAALQSIQPMTERAARAFEDGLRYTEASLITGSGQ